VTVATSVEYRYFSIDASHDITTDVVELSLDRVTWVTATHAAPTAWEIAQAAVDKPIPAGKTRYWVRVLCGPAADLPVVRGRNVVTGRVTDTPEIPELTWTVYAPI
jgi:hypothetical protein